MDWVVILSTDLLPYTHNKQVIAVGLQIFPRCHYFYVCVKVSTVRDFMTARVGSARTRLVCLACRGLQRLLEKMATCNRLRALEIFFLQSKLYM